MTRLVPFKALLLLFWLLHWAIRSQTLVQVVARLDLKSLLPVKFALFLFCAILV
jgi:hypothetical protein